MHRSRHRLRRVWWLLLVISALSIPAVAQAQSKTFYWEQYHTEISVQQNGDLLVEEQQTIVFTSGTFTFGYRTIPMDKTDGIVEVEVWALCKSK